MQDPNSRVTPAIRVAVRGAAGAGKDGVQVINPIPGDEDVKWIGYGGAVVISGTYDENMLEEAEKFLTERAVTTVRQIMERDRSAFRFREEGDGEVVVEWRIKIPKFNWRKGATANEGIVGVSPTDDKRSGLKQKYRVYKVDDNAPVEDCFVLRPGKEPAARIAMEAYAKATENKVLAKDILAAIGDSGRVVVLPVRPVLTPVLSSMLYIIDDGEIYEDALCYALVGMAGNGQTNVIYETLSDQMSFDQGDIGKTVFLTREEAEKALEEERCSDART